MATDDVEKEHKVQEVEAGSVNPATLAPAPTPNQENGKVTFKVWIVVSILSWGYGLSFM